MLIHRKGSASKSSVVVARDVDTSRAVSGFHGLAAPKPNGIGVIGYRVKKAMVAGLAFAKRPLQCTHIWRILSRRAMCDLRSPCHSLASFVPTHGCPSANESSCTNGGYRNSPEFASIWAKAEWDLLQRGY